MSITNTKQECVLPSQMTKYLLIFTLVSRTQKKSLFTCCAGGYYTLKYSVRHQCKMLPQTWGGLLCHIWISSVVVNGVQ